MAHSKRGTRAPDPIRITRPGEHVSETLPVPGTKKRIASSDEIRGFFGGGRVLYTPTAPDQS